LNIEKQFIEDHQVKLTIQVEESDWQKAKRQAARQLSKSIKIPGFRPGRAPYNTVVRHVGEGAIIQEALEITINDVYAKAIEKAEIEPYGPGRLAEMEEFDPPVFEFIIPLEPDVELGDYKNIQVPYDPPESGDEEIDEVIDSIRRQHAVNESVDRPAEEGDIVYMRVSAKRLDVEDEEEATFIDQQFSSARLGQKDSATDHQFFPGFSEHLLGMAPDDTKTFTHTYPDDHEDEELQGKEVEFDVIVTNVQGYALPDLNDELAQAASEFETFEEMRTDIKENLEARKQYQYDSEYEEEVIEKVIADCQLSYPPQAIEDEKEDLISLLEANLEEQNLSKEMYLQFRNLSEEEFEEEMTESAVRKVERTLVLHRIADQEDIEPDTEVLNETLNDAIETATADMTPQQIREAQEDGRMAYFASMVASDMIMDKTVNYLTAIAKGELDPDQEEQPESEEETEAAEQESAPEEGATDNEEEAAPVDEQDSTPEESEET
jgi:trigger factor